MMDMSLSLGKEKLSLRHECIGLSVIPLSFGLSVLTLSSQEELLYSSRCPFVLMVPYPPL